VKDEKYIKEKETRLHKKYKEYQYIPLEKFSGYTECFDIGVVNLFD